ncbi:unnamed protein product [Prunus brigantina]
MISRHSKKVRLLEPCPAMASVAWLAIVKASEAFSCKGKYGVALNTQLLGTPSHKQRQCEACHAQASRHGHGRLVVPCHIQDLPKMKRRGLSNRGGGGGGGGVGGRDENDAQLLVVAAWFGCLFGRFGLSLAYVKGGCLADQENCSPDFFDRVAWRFEMYRRSCILSMDPSTFNFHLIP